MNSIVWKLILDAIVVCHAKLKTPRIVMLYVFFGAFCETKSKLKMDCGDAEQNLKRRCLIVVCECSSKINVALERNVPIPKFVGERIFCFVHLNYIRVAHEFENEFRRPNFILEQIKISCLLYVIVPYLCSSFIYTIHDETHFHIQI